MPIELECSAGHKLRVSRSRAGTTVRCPTCRQPVKVPGKPQKKGRVKRSPGPPPLPPKVAKSAPVRTNAEPSAASLPAAPPDTPAVVAASPVRSVIRTKQRPSFHLERLFTFSQRGCQADSERRRTVYWLAGALAGLALVTMYPALAHFNLGEAPGWARVVMLVALWQLAYAAWMALAPDWSSVWVAMFALAAAAALYATGMAITLTAEPGAEIILDLADLRRTHKHGPTAWCGGVAVASLAMAYVCGVVSHRWHKGRSTTACWPWRNPG